jgi:hypothetical protein
VTRNEAETRRTRLHTAPYLGCTARVFRAHTGGWWLLVEDRRLTRPLAVVPVAGAPVTHTLSEFFDVSYP